MSHWTFPKPPLVIGIFFVLLCTQSFAENHIQAPNMQAKPVNQLDYSANACGPASLMNSFRFGSKKWQRLEKKIKGENTKDQIGFLVSAYGLRVSKHIKGQLRWNRNVGINVEDLTDIANEIKSGEFLPTVKNEAQFLIEKENHDALLKRTHKRLRKSLKKGFPPLLAIQRQARRQLPQRGEYIWMNIQSHFITVISVSENIEKGASSFPITYIDPWRARILHATIHIPTKRFGIGREDIIKHKVTLDSPSLQIDCPNTAVGRKYLKKGEASVVIVGTIMGLL